LKRNEGGSGRHAREKPNPAWSKDGTTTHRRRNEEAMDEGEDAIEDEEGYGK
jgi:hypothetical protein